MENKVLKSPEPSSVGGVSPSPVSPQSSGSTTSSESTEARTKVAKEKAEREFHYNLELTAGKDDTWSKDLKSAPKSALSEDFKKDNPYVTEGNHTGEYYSEKAKNPGDLIRVDIDNVSAGYTINTLPGATAPLYNVALTKATIEKIVLEGFRVCKANTQKVIEYKNKELVIPS